MKRLPYAERVIAVALLDLSGMVHAQQTEVVQLLASDGSSGDFFGHSVSIGGPAGAEIAIVGAHYDDDTSLFAGSVYIYNRNGDFWIQSQKLIASDGEASDLFGFSVSVSGSLGNEVAIIGSVFDDDNGNSSGSAYIFRKSGGLWIQEQKLLASDGDAFDNFGYSVSINEDLAIVGA
ncbi:MAG: FG-GAP repeat protein, partial [Planctomycetota bacterium]|nr:FG-GAP repeat protein [Planctomycetota bacterium]